MTISDGGWLREIRQTLHAYSVSKTMERTFHLLPIASPTKINRNEFRKYSTKDLEKFVRIERFAIQLRFVPSFSSIQVARKNSRILFVSFLSKNERTIQSSKPEIEGGRTESMREGADERENGSSLELCQKTI